MGLLDRPKLAGRSDGLDLLRFGLAFWVVMTHLLAWGGFTATGQPTALAKIEYFNETVLFQDAMHPAVLAFIVLSGYCIHRNGARCGDWSLGGYAIRRALRIVPVFLIASLIGVLIWPIASHLAPAATLNASATSAITLGGLARKLSALTAILPIPHMAHNHQGNAYEGNGALYTVAAEMWLYVFYAAMMTALIRGWLRERVMWAAVSALTLGGLALVVVRPDLRDWYFNASLLGFLPLWWIGAWFVGRDANLRLAVGAVVVCAASTIYLSGHGGVLVVEVRVLALGVVFGTAISLIDAARLKCPPAVTLAGRSGYSLYAFHGPVLYLLIALGVPWPLIPVAAVLVGIQMFRLVERPSTQLGRRLGRGSRFDSAVPGALHPRLRTSR